MKTTTSLSVLAVLTLSLMASITHAQTAPTQKVTVTLESDGTCDGQDHLLVKQGKRTKYVGDGYISAHAISPDKKAIVYLSWIRGQEKQGTLVLVPLQGKSAYKEIPLRHMRFRISLADASMRLVWLDNKYLRLSAGASHSYFDRVGNKLTGRPAITARRVASR